MKIQCDVCDKTIDTDYDVEHADVCPEQILPWETHQTEQPAEVFVLFYENDEMPDAEIVCVLKSREKAQAWCDAAHADPYEIEDGNRFYFIATTMRKK